MKKILFFAAVLVCACSTEDKTEKKSIPAIAYPTIDIRTNGINPEIYPADTLKAEDIFIHLEKYIQRSYVHPSGVVTAKIDGEMIRVNGEMPDACGWVSTFQIDVKDYRYRLSFTDTEGVQTLSEHTNSVDSCFNAFAKNLNEFILNPTNSQEW